MDLDPSLELHNEGAWNIPFDPDAISYSSFNDAGIETETGEFFYALTRLLKPHDVLETGTHWGVGAAYIGMALKANHMGHLDTIEFLPEIYAQAKERMAKLGLSEYVTCHFGDAANFQIPASRQHPYALILLDTEPQTRFAELIKFYEHLMPGGYVFIHDLHRHMHQIPNEEHGFAWPFGKIPNEIHDLVLNDQLRPIHFPTPRGLTGFYKPSADDYQWPKPKKGAK